MSLADINSYALTSCISHDAQEISFLLPGVNGIRIVAPSSALSSFYEKHGLELLALNNYAEVASKVISAIDILNNIQPVGAFIRQIVSSVQILEAEDKETDISYSHPDIPFSIFFSLCEPMSIISDLRVAESILHEAMHLKLTLIENYCSLVKPHTRQTFHSPWRDEQRPIRGVLHGMFVFKAISDLYALILTKTKNENIESFILKRRRQIADEMLSIRDFYNSPGLTKEGRQLAIKLIQ
jgi:HEXXH motif-containing protein